jgi:hypothetical protein
MTTPTIRPVVDHTILHQRVLASFVRQGMMAHLGAQLVRVGPGLCEVALPYSDKVTQQQGGFHGGAMGALASLRGPLDAFFDKVTVNADDKTQRANRLKLLSQIRRTTMRVADFGKIEG